MRSPDLEHVAWLITERGDQRHIESPDLRVRIRTGRKPDWTILAEVLEPRGVFLVHADEVDH